MHSPSGASRSLENSPIDTEPAQGGKVLFQRSISEITNSSSGVSEEVVEEEGNNRPVYRKRNNSGGITGRR